MDALGTDPAAVLKQISQEVQDKFKEAGMDKVEDFIDTMEDIMAKAKEGPGDMLKGAQSQVDALKNKIEETLANPSSIMGDSGAACIAGWYGGEVAKKLRSFGNETNGLVEEMKKMASNMAQPMKDLADALEKAVSQLEASVKNLAKLPKLISQEIQGKDSPDDVAKINTDPMKKALSGADLDEPLKAIGGMKGLLDSAVSALKGGMETMEKFLQSAPETVRRAFDMPAPLCALQSVLMSQAPKLMVDLLGMLEKLQSVSLEPVMKALNNTTEKVGSLDPQAIKTPVNKFMESAKDLVDKLDKTVSGAKLASGGGMPKMPGGMGKMFG